MKRSFLFAALLCSVAGFSQVRMPQPSPTQKITQQFGLGTIELTYSRPLIKGRPVFKDNSELAPLGKLWRTGANNATRIYFSDKVMMGGKLMDTGSYSIFTIPGKDYWEIVINKDLSGEGIFGYKESEDVNRFKVKAEKLANEAESFTMQFGNVLPESCDLQLMWGSVLVRIPMSVNIKDRIRVQVEKETANEKANANVFFAAANYYYEWEKNYPKALSNVMKATSMNKDAYWMMMLQAKIQRDMGDKVSAKASAQKVIEVATAGKNDDYVRQANELIKKL